MFLINKKKILKQQIIDTLNKMNASGINQGSSGNISVRYKDGMLITPSSIAYENLKQSDILYKDLYSKKIESGSHQKNIIPSSEWKLHAEILKSRNEINAVLHCHSIYATALACHHRSIPSFHYMTAVAGGANIRCSEYATFGTEDLAINAIKALKNRSACLLANHGQISIGLNIREAFDLAIEVETLSKIYLKSFQLGEPKHLGPSEMKKITMKFKSMEY